MKEDLSNLDDVEIIKLSLVEKDNFSEIIHRYKDKIRRYIKRLTSVSDDYVDDILQDVFVKAYVNLNGFDQDLSFSSWIYRIAHNETISYFRKNKKHMDATNLISDEDLETFSSEIDIEKEQYKNHFNKVLGESMNELKEKYRSVLVLKFIEGKDYETISDILQKPPGTIATWINRAKKDLKKILEKKGIEEYE
ncbi:MAG: RNA polymerase sigma-70 factor (ECF subfamily) [Candidatus Paceibacteria bacterium]|jgi:RNA polymerase sigma-70 factor (ECF subfamily)